MSAPQWIETVLAEHDYAVNDFGSAARRDGKYLPSLAPDPGWHGCRCGKWAGYWCDFRAHVAAVLWAEFTARLADKVAVEKVAGAMSNVPAHANLARAAARAALDVITGLIGGEG